MNKTFTKGILLYAILFLIVSINAKAFYFNNTNSTFPNGQFNNTQLNPGGYVEINDTTQTGTYISEIFDSTNTSVTWKNLSWGVPIEYQVEDRVPEGEFEKVLLGMLFNNNSDIGENSTHFVDYGFYGNDGNCVNCPTVGAEGLFGSDAVDFDSDNNEEIEILNSDSIASATTEFSAIAWVRPNVGGSAQIIWEQRNNYKLEYTSANKPQWCVYDLAYRCAQWAVAQPMDGLWHSMLGTFNGTDIILYYDGVEVARTERLQFSLANPNESVYIGCDQGTNCFNGTMERVGLWNETLSPEGALNSFKLVVLNLTMSYRVGNQSNLSDATFIGNSKFENFTEIDIKGRYFQYRANLWTDNSSYTPELWDVTIGFKDGIVIGVGYCTLNSNPLIGIGRKMPILCNLTQEADCVISTYFDDTILSTSPKPENILGFGKVSTFSTRNEILNGYYSQFMLIPDRNYTVEVICDYNTFSYGITPEGKGLSEVPGFMFWLRENYLQLFGLVLFLGVVGGITIWAIMKVIKG